MHFGFGCLLGSTNRYKHVKIALYDYNDSDVIKDGLVMNDRLELWSNNEFVDFIPTTISNNVVYLVDTIERDIGTSKLMCKNKPRHMTVTCRDTRSSTTPKLVELYYGKYSKLTDYDDMLSDKRGIPRDHCLLKQNVHCKIDGKTETFILVPYVKRNIVRWRLNRQIRGVITPLSCQ